MELTKEMKKDKLISLGWNGRWENHWNALQALPEWQPARVIVEHKGMYRLLTSYWEKADESKAVGVSEIAGEVSGKFRYNAKGYGDFPAVGDWVAVEPRPGEDRATIHAILPRQSRFSRKVAGVLTQEQVVAANFDHVFITNSLNKDLNLRRIERYMTMTWESGASPVIVLSKKDLCMNAERQVAEVESIAFGVPVLAVSGVTGEGITELRKYLAPGKTVVFLGSSGVGKSTLTNSLAGEEIMLVNGIREDDDKGRHTTTYRQLVVLPDGSMVIDTPGMRELQLWDAEEGLQGAFEDVEALAGSCRFSDCRHGSEPGCAVKAALQTGELTEERLNSYKKLQKELLFLESKQNQAVRLAEKQRNKSIAKAIKEHYKVRS